MVEAIWATQGSFAVVGICNLGGHRTRHGHCGMTSNYSSKECPFANAGPNEVSFLDNQRYRFALDQTLAGAVIVHPDMAARVPTGTVAIRTIEPYACLGTRCCTVLSGAVGFSRYPSVAIVAEGRSSIRRRRSGRCL